MRPAIDSRQAAAIYGLWAGSCVVATSAVVGASTSSGRRGLISFLADCMPYAVLTVFVAIFGWAFIHRRGSQPGPWTYAALAVGIVVVVHLVFVYAEFDSSMQFFGVALFGLMFHGWFTVPVAFAATALFVWWVKRDARARPSRGGREGSRS